MPHFVYIIYSKTFNVYYKGESQDPYKRLGFHNSNLSTYTANKGPWELVYLEEFDNRTLALKREKMLKKQNRTYLEWLIKQPSNKINITL
jgi:putative endonuclease